MANAGPDLGFNYDSYRKTAQKQQFFRIRHYNELTPAFWEDLDIALRQTNDYCNATRSLAQIVLIIVKTPDTHAEPDWRRKVISRVLHPMQIHILEVEFEEVSAEEFEAIRRDVTPEIA